MANIKDQKLVGYVTATVRMPIYENDNVDRKSWDWFVFEEPIVNDKGSLVSARRDCETLESKFEWSGAKERSAPAAS